MKTLLTLQEQQLQQWLKNEEWGRVESVLSELHESQLTAYQWLAGALLWAQKETVEDLSKAIRWAERAHAMHATHPEILSLLTRLYMKMDRLVQAFHFARLLVKQTPNNPHSWAMLGIVAYRSKETMVGAQSIKKACQLARKLLPDEAKNNFLNFIIKYAPFWWSPVKGKSLSLCPLSQNHKDFLVSTQQDSFFRDQYHMFCTADEASILRDIERAKHSPFDTYQIHWVVEDLQARPLGLAALVDLDFRNSRAEGLIGFPNKEFRMQSVEASWLMLEFVFYTLRFNKFYAYIYEKNKTALRYMKHVGFRQEGVLLQHVKHPETGELLDLYVVGMLREDFLANVRNQSIAKKILGRDFRSYL